VRMMHVGRREVSPIYKSVHTGEQHCACQYSVQLISPHLAGDVKRGPPQNWVLIVKSMPSRKVI